MRLLFVMAMASAVALAEYIQPMCTATPQERVAITGLPDPVRPTSTECDAKFPPSATEGDTIPCHDDKRYKENDSSDDTPLCYEGTYQPLRPIRDPVYFNGIPDYEVSTGNEYYRTHQTQWYNPSEGGEWINPGGDSNTYLQQNNWYKEEDGFGARLIHTAYRASGMVEFSATVSVLGSDSEHKNPYAEHNNPSSASLMFNVRGPRQYYLCELSVRKYKGVALWRIKGDERHRIGFLFMRGIPSNTYEMTVRTDGNYASCHVTGMFLDWSSEDIATTKFDENGTPLEDTINVAYEWGSKAGSEDWQDGTIGLWTHFSRATFSNLQFRRRYINEARCDAGTAANPGGWLLNGTHCEDQRRVSQCEDLGGYWPLETESCEYPNYCKGQCGDLRQCKRDFGPSFALDTSGNCCDTNDAGCTADADNNCCPLEDCVLQFTTYTGAGARTLTSPHERHGRYTWEECYWLARGNPRAKGFVFTKISHRSLGICRPKLRFSPYFRKFHAKKTTLIFANANVDYSDLGSANGGSESCGLAPPLPSSDACLCDCQQAKYCELKKSLTMGRFCTVTNMNDEACTCQPKGSFYNLARDPRCDCCFVDDGSEDLDNDHYTCAVSRGIWFDNDVARDSKTNTKKFLTRALNHNSKVHEVVDATWDDVCAQKTVQVCIPPSDADELDNESACLGYRGEMYSNKNRWYPARCIPYQQGWDHFGPDETHCYDVGGEWTKGQCYTTDGDIDCNTELCTHWGWPVSCSREGDETCSWTPGECFCDVDPVKGDVEKGVPTIFEDPGYAEPMPELEDAGTCSGRTFGDWVQWRKDCMGWWRGTEFGPGTDYNCRWKPGQCLSNYGKGAAC